MEDSYNPSDMTEGLPIETEILQSSSSTTLTESTVLDAEISTGNTDTSRHLNNKEDRQEKYYCSYSA